MKLRQRIHELEDQVLYKDKQKECEVLKQPRVHELVDRPQCEDDKNEREAVKQPVCGATHLYHEAHMRGAARIWKQLLKMSTPHTYGVLARIWNIRF
jgi:hypothetical protein